MDARIQISKSSDVLPEIFALSASDADYELWVFPRYYSWQFDDSKKLMYATDAELRSYLNSHGISERVRCALGLIAVGSASEESQEGASREESLAEARARETLHQVTMTLTPIMPLWRLNLGWHDPEGEVRRRATANDAGLLGEKTADQRRFMIILVIDQKSNIVDHAKSLRRAIMAKPEIPYMKYSMKDRFELNVESTIRPRRPEGCPKL